MINSTYPIIDASDATDVNKMLNIILTCFRNEVNSGEHDITHYKGLCYYIRYHPITMQHGLANDLLDHFDLITASWPKFSGDDMYPIGNYDSSYAMFTKHVNEPTMITGIYGQLRMELVNYIIDYTGKLI